MAIKKLAVCLLALVLVASLSVSIAACRGVITGSGKLETRDMDYTDFKKIEVGSAFEVDITKDADYSVSITMDDNAFEYLRINKVGDTLQIGLRQPYSYINVTQRASITVPDLDELELSGASRGEVTGFNFSHSLRIKLSGASSLDIDDIIAGDTDFAVSGASRASGSIEMHEGDFDISGASRVELEGTATDVSMDVSGASQAGSDDFVVDNARINLSGASTAVINASGQIDATVSGASTLRYLGSPAFGDLNISGGSRVEKR
jgi:hypothetical protein